MEIQFDGQAARVWYTLEDCHYRNAWENVTDLKKSIIFVGDVRFWVQIPKSSKIMHILGVLEGPLKGQTKHAESNETLFVDQLNAIVTRDTVLKTYFSPVCICHLSR